MRLWLLVFLLGCGDDELESFQFAEKDTEEKPIEYSPTPDETTKGDSSPPPASPQKGHNCNQNVDCLLSDPNQRLADGERPLHAILINWKYRDSPDPLPIVKQLVEEGAELNVPIENVEGAWLLAVGLTELGVAILLGHHNVVNYLLKVGSDISVADMTGASKRYRGGLFRHASAKCMTEAIKGFIDAGQIEDIDDALSYHIPFATYESEVRAQIGEIDLLGEDCLKSIWILVKAGASSESFNKLLFRVSYLASLSSLRFLVDLGADPLTTQYGRTILHQIAVSSGNYAPSALRGDRVAFFANLGVDLDSLTTDGLNGYKHNVAPLHIAASRGDTVVVEALIRAGADPDVRDSFSNTPLFYAVPKYGMNVVEPLMKGGADPSLKNGDGKTVCQVYRGLLSQTSGWGSDVLRSCTN